MADPIDVLQDQLEACEEWPPKSQAQVFSQLSEWEAFRESNATRLKPTGWATDRNYIVDPLAQRIAEVFPDLIFGRDPAFTAGEDKDQKLVEGIVEENELPSELQRAGAICTSEGEVWWRLLVDRDAGLEYPTVEWHSRLNVIPLWRGRKLLACAFTSVLSRDESGSQVLRYVELHGEQRLRNLVYKGTDTTLGDRVGLEASSQTADLVDEWKHGLQMLAGRVPNRLGRNRQLGISDYAGVRDMLLALNEAASIGQENLELTAKQRVVIPQKYLDAKGRFPKGAEVIIATETDQDPDKPGQGIAQIEWSFDAAALIAYKENLEDTILTRCRVAPQLVGRHTENAQTGPALKARLLDSVLAADGKARFWDDVLPRILSLAQLVHALPTEQGGFGGTWKAAGDIPAVERTSALPENDSEKTLRIAAQVGGEFLSRQSAIEEEHPDWDEERVKRELDQIRADLDLPPADEPADTAAVTGA